MGLRVSRSQGVWSEAHGGCWLRHRRFGSEQERSCEPEGSTHLFSAEEVQASDQATTSNLENVGRDTLREKENVADFVQKKREMFLVQMGLDVKKAEILKLDERSKAKEEALQKSTQMLDEDVQRFDLFFQNRTRRLTRRGGRGGHDEDEAGQVVTDQGAEVAAERRLKRHRQASGVFG